MTITMEQAYIGMTKLWEEAEAEHYKDSELLEQLWKETKDKRIEARFMEQGGRMIDGVYMFQPKKD